MSRCSTWRELLARARAAILDAFSYEWVPIALALDSPTPFAHPLGRVILNIIPPRATGASPPKAGDLAFLERLVPAPSGARGDVAFALGTHDGIISGGLLAAADRFELATIEQQARNLRERFEQFDPAARIMP